MADLIRTVRSLTAPLRRRVLLTIGRAVVTLIDDRERRQILQLHALRGEILDRVERFQDYGITSVPLPPDDAGAAEAVLLAVGGNRQHPLALAVADRRYRPAGLAPGEVCLYTAEDTPAEPHRVILAAGRVARIETGGTAATFNPDSIVFSAGGSTFRMDAQGIRQTAANGAELALDANADINVTLGVDGDINPTGDVDGVKVSTHTHPYTPALHRGPANSANTQDPN